MNCPKCKNDRTNVIDSRDVNERSVRRRRECEACNFRFTTYEKFEPVRLSVLKSNGQSEAFERSKIIRGISTASGGRLRDQDIEELADDVEVKLIESGDNIVPSRRIGRLVINRLKKLDKISYLRFASVYKNFKDVSSFEEELIKLKDK